MSGDTYDVCPLFSVVIMFQLLAGVADATDWPYWYHLESLFKSMPSSTQTANEDEVQEDSSHNFVKIQTAFGMQTSHVLLITA